MTCRFAIALLASTLYLSCGPPAVVPADVSPAAGQGEASGLGSCRPACEDGFACHYEPSAPPAGVCRVAPGRCRYDQDCPSPSSQTCQRFSARLGSCVERMP
jgi:hypothetical protein